jgi:hypothetical protein
MKIAVYLDEAYHEFAHRADERNARWTHHIGVPDEWAERYFAAKAEFEKLTDELADLWDNSRQQGAGA